MHITGNIESRQHLIKIILLFFTYTFHSNCMTPWPEQNPHTYDAPHAGSQAEEEIRTEFTPHIIKKF